MTTTTNELDADVLRYLELTDQIEQLEAARGEIKARLRQLDPGKHESVGGVVVTISLPPRSFNTTKAWGLLNDEQRAVCLSPDPKKMKSQLSEVLIDTCMDPGSGEPRVSIK